MTATLRDLERLANSRQIEELIRMDRNLPRTGNGEQRERLAQMVEDLKTASGVKVQLARWTGHQAEVEEAQDEHRYEVAESELAAEQEDVVQLFLALGIDVDRDSTVGELEDAYPSVSDRVDRHIRDVKNMGPDPAKRLAAEFEAMGAVPIESDEDVVIVVGRTIRDALPGLRALEQQAASLKATVDQGVDPADWDEKHCETLDELAWVLGPSVPLPSEPDPRPSLSVEVEQRLSDWGLLGKERPE